jgi:hypothetical protein
MDDTVVFNGAVPADCDLPEISPDHCARPDTGVLMNLHISYNTYRLAYKNTLGNFGCLSIKT